MGEPDRVLAWRFAKGGVVTSRTRLIVFGLMFAVGCASDLASGEDSRTTMDRIEAGADEVSPQPSPTPSDDPNDWDVDPDLAYEPTLSEPRFVVPSDSLPVGLDLLPANNNVDIAFHEGRLFMAWRNAETHFASPNARMIVVSSGDQGVTWQLEDVIALGADVREPRLLSWKGTLFLYFFEAGTNWAAFEPKVMWRKERLAQGVWTALESWGEPGEVPWDLKARSGRIWLTSYRGNHYSLRDLHLSIMFKQSLDGRTFTPVNPDRPVVHEGGASEAAFEMDEGGSLWAVLRNEDGDETGFGSLLCTAPPEDLSAWDCPDRSDPERYDSPEMFRHGRDIYLVARRDIGGPFDQGLEGLSLEERRLKYLVDYWQRPKRTALYRVDTAKRRIVWLTDLPSAGDTAFPSVRRLDAHSFLLANYTSPLDQPDLTWMEGQTLPEGTRIYLLTISFVAP